MSAAAEAMLKIQIADTERAARNMERQLRKYLAGALCAECGEPLGDVNEGVEIVLDDDDRTVHKLCEKA